MKMTKDALKMANKGLKTTRKTLKSEKNKLFLLKYNQEFMKNTMSKVEKEVGRDRGLDFSY